LPRAWSSHRSARRRGFVVVQVTALYPVYENLCLVNFSPQRSRFAPDGLSPAARAGDIFTFEPHQLMGHLVHLTAQRTEQLDGLGDIV